MSKIIYLDHNSTSPIDPVVADLVHQYHRRQYANPASQHRAGQLARAELERLRSDLISMLGGTATGMRADSLVLTSGGTESDNLALLGLATSRRRELLQAGHIAEHELVQVIISSVEHPAITAAAEQLPFELFQLVKLPVDANGVCLVDTLAELLEQPTALVSVMLANNETGALQPVHQIASICRDRGVACHTDAVQAVGKMPVHFTQLGVDAMTFTAHKLAGPRGIGGLLLRHGLVPDPRLFGGFQQLGIRPGTEDIALVAGMWQAIKRFNEDPVTIHDQLLTFRNRLQNQLAAEFPEMVVNSGSVDRVPQTLNISFPGINRQSLLMSADIEGLAISAGSACASGSSEPSPVLLAMKLDKLVVDGAIRISVGYSNTKAELDDAFVKIKRIVDRLRSQ